MKHTLLKLSTTKHQIEVRYNFYIGYYEIYHTYLDTKQTHIAFIETNGRRAVKRATEKMKELAVQS